MVSKSFIDSLKHVNGKKLCLTTALVVSCCFSLPVLAQEVVCTGSGEGMGGTVKVEVTANENQILDIQVTDSNETAGIGSVAVEEFPELILRYQSLQVDAMAGATITCDAIKDAVRDALISGGFDTELYDSVVVPMEAMTEQITEAVNEEVSKDVSTGRKPASKKKSAFWALMAKIQSTFAG